MEIIGPRIWISCDLPPRAPIAPQRMDLAVRGLSEETTLFSLADLRRRDLGVAPKIVEMLDDYFCACAGVPLRLLPWDGSSGVLETHWPLNDDVARVFAA